MTDVRFAPQDDSCSLRAPQDDSCLLRAPQDDLLEDVEALLLDLFELILHLHHDLLNFSVIRL